MPESHDHIRLPLLPAELLLHIFKLATDNPIRDIEHYVNLPPFESLESSFQEEQFESALRTKYSITLTCSSFRKLCAEILYEDIRVGKGAAGLADILERSEAEAPEAGLGRTVKRTVLIPFRSTEPIPGGMHKNTRRVLTLCPNIRAIVRTRGSEMAEDLLRIDDPSVEKLLFPCLERIDWLSCPSDDPPIAAEMPQSIWSSHSLKTLSVGVKEWSKFTSMRETETVNIYSTIQTLRVRSIDAFGTPGQRLFTLELPSFKRLILDQPDSMYALFSIVAHADQIETLELGLHHGFLEHDYIMVLLVYCLNTTELYFPVFTTFVTRTAVEGAAFTYNIKHVVLHAALDENAPAEEAWKWEHLTSHFKTFCGSRSRFTKLERITLYGNEWQRLVGDPRFCPILELTHSGGIVLACEDEVLTSLLRRRRNIL